MVTAAVSSTTTEFTQGLPWSLTQKSYCRLEVLTRLFWTATARAHIKTAMTRVELMQVISTTWSEAARAGTHLWWRSSRALFGQLR